MEQRYIAQFREFIRANFANDPQMAFDNYKNNQGTMGHPEVVQILKDAGIGGWIITASKIATVVIEKLDGDNGDGFVTFDEIERFLARMPQE